MISFDIIQAVTRTYQLVWAERAYLLRLSAVPFFLCYLNSVGISLLSDDISPLRQGLFLLPRMIIEAWLICQVLRTFMMGERWPIPRIVDAKGNVPPFIIARVHGLLTGIIMYVLIMVVQQALAGTIDTLAKSGELDQMAKNHSPIFLIGGLTVMFIMVRWFKIFWLHIPLVVNRDPISFLRALPGWMISVHMIGLTLAASIPVLAAVMLPLGILTPLTTGTDIGAFIAFIVMMALHVGAQLLISILASVAMAIVMRPILFPSAKV
jgi:hypothetical protein